MHKKLHKNRQTRYSQGIRRTKMNTGDTKQEEARGTTWHRYTGARSRDQALLSSCTYRFLYWCSTAGTQGTHREETQEGWVLACWPTSATDAPEVVAAREVVRTKPDADLASWPRGLAPCHTVLTATCTDSAAVHSRPAGPFTRNTSTCSMAANSMSQLCTPLAFGSPHTQPPCIALIHSPHT